MITVIISDIHGNLEALNSVFEDIKNINVDRIICLGDIIGYGPNPNECLELIKKRNCLTIMGNHEEIYLGNIDNERCSHIGVISSKWTKNEVDSEYIPYIKSFKRFVSYDDCMYTHTGFINNNYPYLNKDIDIVQGFDSEKYNIIFYGHTHRPKITSLENGEVESINVLQNTEINIKDGVKYFINVGSVGQQRDSITNVSYAILQEDDYIRKVSIRRIPYDSYTTYCKIRNKIKSIEISNYLIREQERRDYYENSFNRC